MSDNRSYFNYLQNEGGAPIYVEDQKLSESTAVTAINQEGVMLKGTDGAYYEIDKTSLSEVIRAELGAILADAGNNNGTSVGKVPTLNSSGNALGASSIADLASVLGAPYPRINFTGDADDFAYGTAYVEPATCSNIPPFSGYIIAFSPYTIGESNVRFQIMIGKSTFAYRVKDFKSTWEPWVVISA